MKMTKTLLLFAVFFAANCFAAITPKTEWQDIKPSTTLEDVGKGAGYATATDVQKAVDGLASTNDLQDALREFKVDAYYLYDNTTKPSTNVLDAQGNLYKLSLAPGGIRGGNWEIIKSEGTSNVTYKAFLKDNTDGIYKWTNAIYSVEYNIDNGQINVSLDFIPTNGYYNAGLGNDPLLDMLDPNAIDFVDGYKVDSLKFTRQGPSIKADDPFDSFVRASKYNDDRDNGTVTGIIVNRGSIQHGNVELTIPDTTNLATKQETSDAESRAKSYAETYTKSKLYQADAFAGNIYTPTSVVGRLDALEQTSQEIKHNVVYDLWSSDRTQIINGSGNRYMTHNEPYGAWERVVTGVIMVYTNGTKNADETLWTWRAQGGSYITYCPTNGAVCFDGAFVDNIATNLNPEVDDLGTVRNESVASGNRLTFVMAGEVRNPEAKDHVVFSSGIASDAVTGIRWDGRTVYSKGLVDLPNYTSTINGLKDDIKTTDMDTAWPNYAANSIVGRIKELEGGGANKAFLNRTDMDKELVDDEAKTNNSVVGYLYRVKNDYVKHATATSIAETVAADVASNVVDNAYIKDQSFYDKAQIDDMLDSKIEQKRVDYVYDDVDDPKQVMDSDGKLFWFGIDDLGGRFNATNSTEGSQYLGDYLYKGFANGTNRWTNVYAKVIWYEPETGKMGDSVNGAYEGSIEPGLVPTNCARIADISTDRLKAEFIPQVTNVNHAYSMPYDKFAKKSETDQTRAEDLENVTNSIPRMYAASTDPATRRFNPLFTALGSWDLAGSSTQFSLNDGRAIRMPIDTKHNSKVEIGFRAQIPSSTSYKSYTFLKSSSPETVPSIVCSNSYIYAEYPQRQYIEISNLPSDKQLDFTLAIDKQQGKATFTVTNVFSGGYWSRTFPSGFNTSKAYGDTIDLCYSDTFGMGESQLFVDLQTVYIRYAGADGEWLDKAELFKNDGLKFGDGWQQTYKLFAERAVAPSGFVELRAATPDKYGLVKFDGTTIRTNEFGQLEADAGGVDLQQVIDVVAKTNTADIAGIDSNSTAGRAIDAQTRIGLLETQVQELITTISNLNTRIEAALNGN